MEFIDTIQNFIIGAWDAIPATILGMPKEAFFGLVIGIVIACYEGLYTKCKNHNLKLVIKGKEVDAFNKIYLTSGVIAIIVTFLTVALVMESGEITGGTSFATALGIGFTEGGLTIKYLNTRIDNRLMKIATKAGATEEQAKEIADAVDFVEVDEAGKPVESHKDSTILDTKFEEL